MILQTLLWLLLLLLLVEIVGIGVSEELEKNEIFSHEIVKLSPQQVIPCHGPFLFSQIEERPKDREVKFHFGP